MGWLKLNLLGKPEILHGEQPLALPTRKALALLIYLAVEGKAQSRERAAALLWPESDERLARANLRTVLRDLRRALAHSPSSAAPDHLLIDRDAVAFNFEAGCELDVHSLRDALATSDPAALAAAVAHCRGDFLEGFSVAGAPEFDDWAGYQREHWRLRLNKAFDRLSQLQSEGGQRRQAIVTLNRWLALDPLHEPAYRRLMRLHLANDDRTAALQVYEKCRLLLAEDLSIEPAAETEALYEQARRYEAGGKAYGNRASYLIPHTSDLPFVGRAAEHHQLVEAYFQAQSGSAQAVAIEAPAGMGKTRLAAEFLAWASGRGAIILQGKAFESGGRLPYQPIIDAFRPIFKRQEESSPLPLSPGWLAELSRLWPELNELFPDLPAPVNDHALAHGRLFEALARLSEALAQKGPLIILLDDVQWTDTASRDVLSYLAQRWRERAVACFLLLAVRAEDVATAPPLEEWLLGLGRELPWRRLALGALTAEEVAGLISTLALPESDKSVARRFGRWLTVETQGQPFYLVETLQALMDQGVIARRQDATGRWRLDLSGWPGPARERSDDWWPLWDFVAPGVRQLIRSRLARLSPTAQTMLTAAAVLGRSFSFRQLCRVAAVDQDDGLAALDELLAHHLLAETEATTIAPAALRYIFSHDKIGSVVYQEVSHARRRLFHERALDYWRAQAGPAALLAYHAEAAGLIEPFFSYSLAAGDEALRLLAVPDAIDHYERARQSLAGADCLNREAPPAQRRRLYEQLGRAYEINNEWEKALTTYQEMLAFARRTATPAIEVVALNRLAGVDILMKMPGTEQALAWLEAAHAVAEASGDERGLAETELNLAQMRFYTYERQAAENHAARALALARRDDDRALLARSLNALAYARCGRTAVEDVRPLFEEARALYAALDNRVMEADCLASLAGICVHYGQLAAAARFGRQAWAIVQEIENPWGQAHAAFQLGGALLEQGNYDEARALLDSGVEVARTHRIPIMLMATLAMRGALFRQLQAVEQARSDHLEGWEIARSLSPVHLASILAGHLCSDAILAGDWAEAEQLAQEALPGSDFSWMLSGFTYWHVIEALLRAGQQAEAQRAAERFGRLTATSLRCQIPYRRCLALLAAADGDAAQAINHLQAALALAEQMGLPHERAAILARLGNAMALFATREAAFQL